MLGWCLIHIIAVHTFWISSSSWNLYKYYTQSWDAQATTLPAQLLKDGLYWEPRTRYHKTIYFHIKHQSWQCLVYNQRNKVSLSYCFTNPYDKCCVNTSCSVYPTLTDPLYWDQCHTLSTSERYKRDPLALPCNRINNKVKFDWESKCISYMYSTATTLHISVLKTALQNKAANSCFSQEQRKHGC